MTMAVAASYEQANASPSPLPPRDDSRPGSTSNATLQTLSNAKRSRTSCRSTTADSAPAADRNGSRRSATSERTASSRNVRMVLVLNPGLASLRCVRQWSPSELKMPRPSRSSSVAMERGPLG
ncbi:putative cytochrome P450 94B3-like [Iris pallida]|uniref:Cytochrome P450 94B3-like n=1 Tax=Iris pallida TaxID=29817 RepID=A0AAX6FVR0_IRIPA|nr:putative cytochrome P450 94B3-like [Iris pallida]KAJ6820496.1 putative cytochrome P450 94B3-like [Iris pallida]